MKTILSLFLILAFFSVHAQDSSKINEINLLVSAINTSTLPLQRDTLIQDHPEVGLKITTYLSMLVSNNELLKYVSYVVTSMNENGVSKQMTGANTFYYNHNKLIKVEEYLIDGEQKHIADWYYSDEKPFSYTLKSDQAENRAALLLTMSQTILKQIIK